MARLLGHVLGGEVAELRMGVEARADGGAADRELEQPGDRMADLRNGVVDLGDPGGDLLAERDRRRVLQVRAANLDDVGELLGLRVERVAKDLDVRQQVVLEDLDGGDVHGGRERVVRRLAAVDMVVRVHRHLRAHLAAGLLDRAVRDDLVDVHVRLRARTGLPDDEREVIIELAGDDFVGSTDHHVGDIGR